MQTLTRSRVILLWFAAVALIVATGVALGVSVTTGTGAMLLVMILVPPAVVLFLWPGGEPQTIGDVLRGPERRG